MKNQLKLTRNQLNTKSKPIQTAIITTTQSILDLQKLLIDVHGFSLVLTARFSQDSLGTLK